MILHKVICMTVDVSVDLGKHEGTISKFSSIIIVKVLVANSYVQREYEQGLNLAVSTRK